MCYVNMVRATPPMQRLAAVFLALATSIFAISGPVLAANESEPAPNPETETTLANDIDVGVVFPFAMIDVTSQLTNTGNRAVHIDRIAARWPGTEAKIDFVPASVLPGEAYRVGLKIQNADGVGRFSHVFLLFDNKHDEPVGKIAVRGFSDWLVDPKTLIADLGVLSDAESIERVLKPQSRPGTSVKLTEVSGESDMFEASVVEGGSGVRIKNRPHLPWGPFDATIVVDTDSPLQKKVGIHVTGEVRGPIIPSMSTVEFGVVRVGELAERAVRLVDEAGKKVTVGKIEISGASAKARVEDCIPKVDSCKLVKLSLKEDQMGSAPRGLMRISFPDYGAVLPIVFGGAIIGKDTVVRDLEKEVEAARSSKEGLSAALKSSTTPIKPLEMPVPEGKGPLLKWEMANESPIYGYEVYRSDRSAGPFSRANSEIVPRLSDDPGVPSIYRWRDLTAKAGNEYWYYIGVVYLDGRKESLNSAQKVIAKGE